MKRLGGLLILLAVCGGCDDVAIDPTGVADMAIPPLPPIDQIQVKGNHRSDWRPMGEVLIDGVSPRVYEGVSRPSMSDQFEVHGARVFHFGFHLTDQGGISPGAVTGYYSRPQLLEVACHYVTLCVGAVENARAGEWEGPIFVLLEWFPNPWFEEDMVDEYTVDELQAYGWPLWRYTYEVDLASQAIPRDRIWAPNDAIGEHGSVREAIERDGWPTLEELDDKFIFILIDRRGALRETYLGREWAGVADTDPDDPRFFVASGDPDDQDAIFFSFEGPGADVLAAEKVRQGFMVHGAGESGAIRDFEGAGAQLLTAIDMLDISFDEPVRCNPETADQNCDVSSILPAVIP